MASDVIVAFIKAEVGRAVDKLKEEISQLNHRLNILEIRSKKVEKVHGK